MKTHIDNLAFNCKDFEQRNPGVNREQLRRLKQGKISRCQTVEQIAKIYDKSIAELFVRPGANRKDWANSDLNYFASTFNTYLNLSGLSDYEIGMLTNVSVVAISNYKKSESLPPLDRLQCIADVLGIEVGDLLIPVRSDVKEAVVMRRELGIYRRKLESIGHYPAAYSNCISHRFFLAQNIIRAMQAHGTDYSKNTVARKIAKGQTVKVDAIEQLSRRYGLSVGDAFLNPKTPTDWYKDSRMIYLPQNMESHRETLGFTYRDMAKRTHLSEACISKIESDKAFATLAQTQEIANCLEIEISDLFLPIDGIG